VRTALIILTSLALLALAEAAFHIAHYLSGRRSGEVRRRLQGPLGPLRIDSNLLRTGRFASIPALDTWLASKPWARRLEHLLEQADSRMTVAQLCGFSALGGCAGALSGFWVGFGPGMTLAVVGVAATPLVLLRARARRSRALSEQLPEALDMMSRSLRAGHALTSAFELVAGEMPEPISVEFGRAFEEQRLGMPLERAVREMAARAPANGDLKLFAVSTVIQKETGGNLAEILDGISATVRERYRFFGKLRALTAESRASAWVVSAMPPAMALFLAITQTAYLAPLVHKPLGRAILTGGIAAWILGFVWFQRLTKFRY
jgi:tight adherence protein B